LQSADFDVEFSVTGNGAAIRSICHKRVRITLIVIGIANVRTTFAAKEFCSAAKQTPRVLGDEVWHTSDLIHLHESALVDLEKGNDAPFYGFSVF